MTKLISLCMIVKNEEKVLASCLESVRGLVDEIIVVDTGSEDGTISIAHQYTDQVYHFEWQQDFSAARNESLRYATGKWILVLDADEYVQNTDHEQIRQMLYQHNDPRTNGFTIKIMNFTGDGEDETKITESPGARLFRNDPSIRYANPIHEQLRSNKGALHLPSLEFTIFHTGYTREIMQQKNKSERNMTILKAIEPNRSNDPYFQFILGNEYLAAEQTEQAILSFQLSYQGSKPADEWYFHLLDCLITLEIQEGYYQSAYTHIQSGIQYRPNHADYYCLKAILLDTLGFWETSILEFKKCIQIAEKAEKNGIPYWVIKPTYGKIIPYQMLGEIHRKKGDLANAFSYWIKTLQLQPKNYRLLQQLIDHLLVSESSEDITKVMEQIYPCSVAMNTMLLFKMALLTGQRPLVQFYRDHIDRFGITVPFEDEVVYELLNNRFELLKNDTYPSLPAHIAIAVSLISSNAAYAQIAQDQPDICLQLFEQAMLIMQNREQNAILLLGKEQLLAQSLLFLWKFQHHDLYFTLLQRMADSRTLNLLAESFYRIGRTNEALDLYSLLLDNQVLETEGLRTVGQWYLNMGETKEAYAFIKASVESNPTIDLLGRIKENYSSEEDKELLHLWYSHYPNLRDFSIH
ncbi:glycosyltransferase family 2 protein [Cohnella mopanensis]|uniref:glycosyltransferase family 2 protein n=1 Tax=Cohnella mopanensis TaxID=2911966 RepID=UPI001EF96BDC|nr:glycosyltransferase family 2 protein [Cohnella mopanensis]